MLTFPIKLLKSRKKEINVKNEIDLTEFYFSYKDKNGLHYENIKFDFVSVEYTNLAELTEHLKNHVNSILERFNKTLKPYESKRTLVNVYLKNDVVNLKKL
jgi:hypothetical protein